MIKSGLVSITFRKLTPKQIVELVKKSGLSCIEWGGDIHVPHGDIKAAREVAKITNEEGLCTASYGSYYRVGCSNDFEAVLDTAKELKAPIIRVWAGNKGTDEADSDLWEKVVEDSNRISEMAQKKNIKIAFEFHGNTLTDTYQSTVELLKKVDHPNLYTYWQPPVGMEQSLCIEGLKSILPWLTNIHVFEWIIRDRQPLSDGIEKWKEYIKIIREDNKYHAAMIEFVKNDDPEQFLKDAEALKNILNT